MTTAAAAAFAADERPSESPPRDALLLDSMGRVVRVPPESVPAKLRPYGRLGLKHQTPQPVPGAKIPDEVMQRMQAAREGVEELRWFPAHQPPMMSYLASIDEFGTTALKPGALVRSVPWEPLVERAKSALAEHGLRYSLDQTLTYVALSDVASGASDLAYYTFDLKAKWAVFDNRNGGAAGWISTEIEAKAGLNGAARTQSAQTNIGSITTPTEIWSRVNGFRIPELAWQQSLRDGEIVIVAGMVSAGNYFDANAYASTGRRQFLNSALINSMVLPLPAYNFGANVQWQPAKDWYGMLGGSVGEGTTDKAPWSNYDADTWSVLGELGYAPDDFLDLGPGVYRVQPFAARAGGPVQGGLGFNFQQQLGRHSPFGWFGRFGSGGSRVTGGASAQVATGLVMQAPLEYTGLVPRLSNDLMGVGFVWSQPSATTQIVYHENEYVFEAFYTLQLTPTTKLQPNLQIVWNPAFNPDPGPAVVAQIQLDLAW